MPVLDHPLAMFEGLKASWYADQKRRKKSRFVILDRPSKSVVNLSSC
jgi:hypothetical protein